MAAAATVRVGLEELRRAPEAVLARLVDGGALALEAHGEVVALLLSPPEAARRERERELLRRLALGELEAAAGEGHRLDQVLAECDLLLDEQ